MWMVGHFSLDNISLMALATSVGFVVDDAIVMIENNRQKPRPRASRPFQAALVGSRRDRLHSHLDLDLADGGLHPASSAWRRTAGRLFREFSVTLAFAIIISTIASLTITPMISRQLHEFEAAA